VDWFTAKENLARCVVFWSSNSAQSLNTLKLVNDPGGICKKKVRNILYASVLRVNNFDTSIATNTGAAPSTENAKKRTGFGSHAGR
jgi:hypothetical protein